MKNNNNKIINLFDETDSQNYNVLIEKLYKEQYMYFYRVAYSILQNTTDAEDAVNEAFSKSYKYINTISRKKCLEIIPYFVNIVKSVSINMKKRQNKLFFSDTFNELLDNINFTEGSDAILERIQEHEDLNTLLNDLSTFERNILEFRVIDRLTFKEIAKRIDLSEEAAKKRYQRLLKKLKETKERRGE